MNRETFGWLAILCTVAIVSGFVVFFRSSADSKRPTQVVAPPSSVETPEDTLRSTSDSGSQQPLAPILGQAPSFTLTSQNGDDLNSDDLRDKVWIANFIFTRCAATCPAQTQALARLQSELQSSLIWEDIRIVSITVDPEFDRPEVLQKYATSFGADERNWHFLTGSRNEIWELAKSGFKMMVDGNSPDPAMPIMHDSKFVVVDRRGQIRGYVDGLSEGGELKLRKLLDHVLPEMAQSTDETTHLAQPPEILVDEWFQSRAAAQHESLKNTDLRHDFRFRDQLQESGIDFDPQIVDEQRWRLQVNHYDHGNGVAVADVDGDGKLDIYFLSQVGANALCRNLGNGKFENISAAAGVGVKDRISVTASFADIDNDHDPDLFVTTVRGGNLLFENDGSGVFRDITDSSGLGYVGHSSSGLFFDYDRDGQVDLFLTNVGKYTTEEYAAVRKDSTTSFSEDEVKYYVGTADAFAGHLKENHSERSILFKNMDGKRFVDVSEEVGLLDQSWSGAATPMDANGDGWLDLYVLNMQGHDEYYENDGGKRFVKRSREVFPRTPWGAMGVKSFDFDNDGLLDLFVTDMHSDMSDDVGPSKEKLKSNMQWPEAFLQTSPASSVFGNAFFKNVGSGKFEEISDQIGAENYWPWGLSVGDLNADGFVDAFVTSSMCFPYRYAANSLLLNDQGRRFVDSEFVLGVEPRAEGERLEHWFELDCDGLDSENPMCRNRSGRMVVWSARGSRSSVIFDVDDDGDLDIVTNEFNSPPQVLTSDLSTRHPVNYLKVSLRGTESNADGLGAFVTLTVDGQTMVKLNDGQSGYLSQSQMPLYFGLGSADHVDQLTIAWPSGKTQQVEGPIPANQVLSVLEE